MAGLQEFVGTKQSRRSPVVVMVSFLGVKYVKQGDVSKGIWATFLAQKDLIGG